MHVRFVKSVALYIKYSIKTKKKGRPRDADASASLMYLLTYDEVYCVSIAAFAMLYLLYCMIVVNICLRTVHTVITNTTMLLLSKCWMMLGQHVELI